MGDSLKVVVSKVLQELCIYIQQQILQDRALQAQCPTIHVYHNYHLVKPLSNAGIGECHPTKRTLQSLMSDTPATGPMQGCYWHMNSRKSMTIPPLQSKDLVPDKSAQSV